jgi:GTPase-associated protein 1
MTMHQLYYTSCEDGLEGIQGFQISAMTPGAPKPLVELAVRTSAYEAGPGLATQDGSTDLSAFPVAFGYVPSGLAATLFQSRYTGSDFTGRTGNYFAHAVLLEDTDRELGNRLPIDMWRSPTWVHTRPRGTDLPTLDRITPGDNTSQAVVRQFLSGQEPGRLALMISAVQRVLTDGRGRVVLVVRDDQTAALWLAALCRSFPRHLGLGISFLTYTSRPENAGVLVSCTTPDVYLPTYGDFAVIDMTTDSPADDPTRYATLLGRLWTEGAVNSATLLANQVSPPLTAGELDAFAVLVECANGVTGTATGTLLLDAVELAVQRSPGMLDDSGWERLAELLGNAGGPVDLTRWSGLVQEAVSRREPVPADLLSAYYVAALGAPERLWLPPLDGPQLEHVAAHSVLPAITGTGSGVLLDRLAEHPSLCAATASALEQRLAVPDALVPLVATMEPRAASLLRRRQPGRQVKTLADLVLARAGQEDRVAALAQVVDGGELDWSSFGTLLWPDEPSTQEAERALRTLPVDVLTETGLLNRIVGPVLDRADRGEPSPEQTRLVQTLLDPRLANTLSPAHVKLLTAASFTDYFRQAAPKQDLAGTVKDSLKLYPSLQSHVGDRLLGSVAEFILRGDAAQHRELLDMALEVCGAPFLTHYAAKAVAKLDKASANHVAATIVVWWSIRDKRTQQRLINETLASALKRRRAKQLDKIGELLKPTAGKLTFSVTPPKDGWTKWWRTWRSTHQSRSLLSRLGLRKGR